MPRIRLDHVFYDPQYRAFRATAVVQQPTGALECPCYWPGSPKAEFARVAQGLADDAIARIG